MPQGILIFALFLAPLIFFHELGHFLFARLFGVRVEVFSIGFGPKILKFKKGDTQYTISLIPLGGYVKMFGDDLTKRDELPAEEKQFAYNNKGKWARFWIVFGGPLANFILAFVLFFFLLLVGEKVPDAVVGNLPTNSVLFEKGLRPGDKFRFVNGQEVLGFADIAIKTESKVVQSVDVERDGTQQMVKIGLQSDKFLEETIKHQSLLRKPLLVDLKGNFYFVGTSKEVNTNVSLYSVLTNETADKLMLSKASKKDNDSREYIAGDFYKEVPNRKSIVNTLEALRKEGLYPHDLFVETIMVGMPADKAGIKPKSVITSVNGMALENFNQMRDAIQETGAGQSLTVEYFFEGKRFQTKLTPQLAKDNKTRLIGVGSGSTFLPMSYVKSRGKGLLESISLGLTRTWDGITTTVISFKKLIMGQASLKNLGGPIAIGKVANDSLKISFSYFINLMALISINLGIINLFPIPVLDGGHIVFIGIEAITRKPISPKIMMVAQQVGFSLLLLLIIFSIANDVSRHLL